VILALITPFSALKVLYYCHQNKQYATFNVLFLKGNGFKNGLTFYLDAHTKTGNLV